MGGLFRRAMNPSIGLIVAGKSFITEFNLIRHERRIHGWGHPDSGNSLIPSRDTAASGMNSLKCWPAAVEQGVMRHTLERVRPPIYNGWISTQERTSGQASLNHSGRAYGRHS